MIHVVFLGFGNLNHHLFIALSSAKNVVIKQVFNRSSVDSSSSLLKNVPCTQDISKLMDADVYIIGIPDDAIAPFSESLPIQNKLIVHTSGGVNMSELSNNSRRGVFYPLQTFSKQREVNFKNIPICIEAENVRDLELLRKLGECISENVVGILSEKRLKLHLAAVFVNNFVNHLYAIGSDILNKENLPFDLLKPLISETALKIETLSPKAAQTGPARRKDQKTIDKHLKLLENSDNKEFYELFTKALKNV